MKTTNKVEPHYGEDWTDEKLVQYADDCLTESKEWFDPIWTANKKLYDMYYGQTLSERDRAFLVRTKRPPIAFNYAHGTINALVGSDQSDKKEVVFEAHSDDATNLVVGDWETKLDRIIMQRCRGSQQESDAFMDALIGGYGFVEHFLDTSHYPIQVVTRRVQPWECYPDPYATEDCLTDGKYFIRQRAWTQEETEARWPDKKEQIRTKISHGDFGTSFPGAGGTSGWVRRTLQRRTKSKLIIYDFLYKRFVPKVVWVDPETGEEKDTLQDEFTARQKELTDRYDQELAAYSLQVDPMTGVAPEGIQPPQPMILEESYRYAGQCIYRAYIAGSESGIGSGLVLERKKLDLDRFPYTADTAFKRKDPSTGQVRFFGPMTVLYDAQLYVNKSLSVYLDILARGSKGGGFIERDAIVGKLDDFIEQQSIPGWWHVVAPGAIAEKRIQEKGVQPYPHSIDQFLHLCINAIAQMTGVTDWVKGTAMQERSNVLISNLQQQSFVMLNPLYDPLERFRIEGGLVRAALRRKLPPPQIDQMIGPLDPKELRGVLYDENDQPIVDQATGEPLTPASLLQRANLLEFDLAVDVGQASPTARHAAWQIWQQGVLKTVIDAITASGLDPSPLVVALMKNVPVPGTQAKILGEEYEAMGEQRKLLQSQEGIVQAALGLGPEGAAQIASQLIQTVQTPEYLQGGEQPPS